jgi:hypothetical protein
MRRFRSFAHKYPSLLADFLKLVKLVTPPEMGVLTTAFTDVTYEIASSDPPMFETHFKYAYVCASLNSVDASACWPLFNVSFAELVVVLIK